MYVPAPFKPADPRVAGEIIDANPFALIVSQRDGEPVGTHLPLDLDRSRGAHGTLVGHLARSNDHWQALDGATVLSIFSGPHAYVSPRWYATAPAVPTWNYVAVHAYGRATVIQDPARLAAILAGLTRRYEGDGPWRMADLPEAFTTGMLRGIVGLEIEVTRLEAKLKLSQNRSVEDRRRVAAALRESGETATADAMDRNAIAR